MNFNLYPDIRLVLSSTRLIERLCELEQKSSKGDFTWAGPYLSELIYELNAQHSNDATSFMSLVPKSKLELEKMKEDALDSLKEISIPPITSLNADVKKYIYYSMCAPSTRPYFFLQSGCYLPVTLFNRMLDEVKAVDEMYKYSGNGLGAFEVLENDYYQLTYEEFFLVDEFIVNQIADICHSQKSGVGTLIGDWLIQGNTLLFQKPI